MKNHCMVDIETLGTRPGSVILSIGAVMFDPATGELGETFYVNIDRASCEALGLTVDQATLDWWEKQSVTARSVLGIGAGPLEFALTAFSGFWGCHAATFFWSHGANFDEVLLSAAYRAANMSAPWKYYDVMCCRSTLTLAGIRPDRSKGTHHNALDDALRQAEAVSWAYKILHLAA